MPNQQINLVGGDIEDPYTNFSEKYSVEERNETYEKILTSFGLCSGFFKTWMCCCCCQIPYYKIPESSFGVV